MKISLFTLIFYKLRPFFIILLSFSPFVQQTDGYGVFTDFVVTLFAYKIKFCDGQ